MRYLQLATENLPEVNSRYLAGMSVKEGIILAWFTLKRIDASALSLSLLHNAMVKSMLGINYNIQVIDSPVASRDVLTSVNQIPSLLEPLVIMITFGMAFVSSFYIIFHIRERISKAKLLQIVSGLNICTFWLSSFFFDFITYMLTVFIVILTLVACQKDGWSSGSDLSPVMATLTAFGFATLPMMYVLSFIFPSPTAGLIWMIAVSVVLSKKKSIFHLKKTNLFPFAFLYSYGVQINCNYFLRISTKEHRSHSCFSFFNITELRSR